MKARVLCLEELKQMCNEFLELCISGCEDETEHFGEDVEVRFINEDGSFGYTYVCDLFFYHDRMYYWTQSETTKEHLTLSDFELYGSLEILEIFGDIKIFPVVYAGTYTGYMDDKGRKIYTGDVVKATIFTDVDIPSYGEMSRAKLMHGEEHRGCTTIVGIDEFGHRKDDYYYILDNMPIPLRNTKKVKIIGNVFYDIDRDNMAVDIRGRCCMLAFPYRINIRNLHLKMAHAPNFKSRTWQEQALHLLTGEEDYESLPVYY